MLAPVPRVDPDLPAARPDLRIETETAGERLRRRRQARAQILAMSLGSYAIDTLLMLGLAAVGTIAPPVAWAFAGAGLSIGALFHLLTSGPRAEHRQDRYLVTPQLLAHATVILAFIAWAPQIGGLLLLSLLLVFGFASLRMTLRTALVGSLLTSALVGTVIVLPDERLALPMGGLSERALSGLWIALTLVRVALLGLYSSELRTLLARRNAQLTEALGRLELLAHRDELTGALNRRSMMQLLDDERRRVPRSGQPFAVALIDIDHFKRVNDLHGHLAGDDLLRRFTIKLAAEMRVTDRLGRYGGEEFLLLLAPSSDAPAAAAAVERIRAAVEHQDWSDVAPGLQLTFSAGVAMWRDAEAPEQLLGRADRALYRAKREGRNCVRTA